MNIKDIEFNQIDTVGNVEFNNETIKEIKFVNDQTFSIDCGTIYTFEIDQQCCENRYLHTDDDFKDAIGATLLYLELLDSKNTPNPNDTDDNGTITITFVHIHTTNGVFTIQCYNEHNGHYERFVLSVDIKNNL